MESFGVLKLHEHVSKQDSSSIWAEMILEHDAEIIVKFHFSLFRLSKADRLSRRKKQNNK